MLKNILLSLAAATAAFSMSAIEVATEAGGLREAVGENTSATALKVTGTINYADFRFLAEDMPELETLDLSGATVTAYSGTALSANRSDYPAAEIPEYALVGSKAQTIVLPAGVTAIGEGAFAGNDALTTITVPSTVTSMGVSVFTDCTALTTATIQANITELPANTFAGCTALRSVTLPVGLTTIGDAAFLGATSLKNLTFPAGLTTICARAFYGSAIRQADLSATQIKTIGPWAFANCPDLSMSVVPTTVESMGEGAFFADASLQSFSFPASLAEVPDYAFKGDAGLRPATFLHDDITSIGDYALADWDNSTSLIFPTKLTHLGSGAMANWTALEEADATFLKVVPTLGEGVWEGVNQEDVTVSVTPTLMSEFSTTSQWREFHLVDGSQNVMTEVKEGEDTGIRAYFDGALLHVESVDPLAEVRLFDLAGRQMVFAVAPNTTSIVADTSMVGGDVLIVRVATITDRASAFKLAR